jgi:WhiB family redox-sensing transcriptional regulator
LSTEGEAALLECRACHRSVTGVDRDRLVHALCPSCYRSWCRAGRPASFNRDPAVEREPMQEPVVPLDVDELHRQRAAALFAGVDLPTLDELLDRPAWHADAACKEHPRTTWFPERGKDARRAIEVCGRCLVLDECRTWALGQPDDPAGIWGGLSGRERRRLRSGASEPAA